MNYYIYKKHYLFSVDTNIACKNGKVVNSLREQQFYGLTVQIVANSIMLCLTRCQ